MVPSFPPDTMYGPAALPPPPPCLRAASKMTTIGWTVKLFARRLRRSREGRDDTYLIGTPTPLRLTGCRRPGGAQQITPPMGDRGSVCRASDRNTTNWGGKYRKGRGVADKNPIPGRVDLGDTIRANQLMIRMIQGYLHAQLEIPDQKGFPRRQSQCHPSHGNFSMGAPVGPKFYKGAAPRRGALRTTRSRAGDRNRVQKVAAAALIGLRLRAG